MYDDQEFHFKNGKLILVYGRGEICARAVGLVPIEIEKLVEIINPNGPLSFVL